MTGSRSSTTRNYQFANTFSSFEKEAYIEPLTSGVQTVSRSSLFAEVRMEIVRGGHPSPLRRRVKSPSEVSRETFEVASAHRHG